jgi:uncharacterized protein
LTTEQVLASYKSIVTTVTSQRLHEPVSRDADDDAVLACALAARADLVISGDEDLLVLQRFKGIAIVTVREAISRFDAMGTDLA